MANNILSCSKIVQRLQRPQYDQVIIERTINRIPSKTLYTYSSDSQLAYKLCVTEPALTETTLFFKLMIL